MNGKDPPTAADLEVVRAHADKLLAEAKLHAVEEANRARNQITVAFGLVATALGLLSAFGLNGFVRDIARSTAAQTAKEESREVVRRNLPEDLAQKVRLLYETSSANTTDIAKQRETARQLVEVIRSTQPVGKT